MRHDRVLGDALERPGRQRRRDDDAVAHGEDVLAGALGDQAVRGEHDRLVVAGLQRLDLGERAVDVVADGLRGRRHRVVVVAGPRRDLHPHALRRPRRRRGTRPTASRRSPRRPCTAACSGPSRRSRSTRSGARSSPADRWTRPSPWSPRPARRPCTGSPCPRMSRAAEQALDVLGQAEHGRALRGLVGADALEHAGAVVQRVGEDVDLRLVPVDELAVHPDLRRRLDRHRVAPVRWCRVPCAGGAALSLPRGGDLWNRSRWCCRYPARRTRHGCGRPRRPRRGSRASARR